MEKNWSDVAGVRIQLDFQMKCFAIHLIIFISFFRKGEDKRDSFNLITLKNKTEFSFLFSFSFKLNSIQLEVLMVILKSH